MSAKKPFGMKKGLEVCIKDESFEVNDDVKTAFRLSDLNNKNLN